MNKCNDREIPEYPHCQSVQVKWACPAHLSVVQVAEAPDDLLLVELVGLQLHASDGLHGAVVLQTLLPGHHHLGGRSLVQLVGVGFLRA